MQKKHLTELNFCAYPWHRLDAAFVNKVMSLFSQPSASVLVNGSFSELFHISNRTHQGWPLSPLLFVIVIEHLVRAIRQNDSIFGIQTPSSHHKRSLFTDDLLVYVQQPHMILPSLLHEFRWFGEFRNFKLNMSKMEALNLSLLDTTIFQLCTNFSFQWLHKGISYLGTTLPSNLSNLYSLNYFTMLTRIWKDLDSWSSSSLPWFERINVLTMDILPKLLYLFQTIPILMPKHFFTFLSSMSIHFVWNRGLSCILYKLLTLAKLQGGVGLPDFELYHRPAVLARVLKWFSDPFCKASTIVEQDLSPVDLRARLWGYKQDLNRLQSSSPRPSLSCNYGIKKVFRISCPQVHPL